MRVWVSGAAGFVGRRLVARLVEAGHAPIGVDREVEISDAARVRESIAGARPDALVHLAAQSSAALALREPEATARVNYLGSRCVLEAARLELPKGRVLLVSSGDVYGRGAPGRAPFLENDALAPDNPYAVSKACADLLAARYAEAGLDVLRARPFNHTGPGQAEHFVAASFARQVRDAVRSGGEVALKVGNLDSVRDFLDVEDVVDAYLRLLDPAVPAGVYNIASGVGRRIGELLDALIDTSGARCRVEVDPERVRPTDHAVGDAGRLRAATGWEPRISWDETLQRLLSDA